MKIIFIFSCSGMFRVPGFIDGLLRLTIRDSVPESYQGRPQLLETFNPSNALSNVKNENDAIRNRITKF